MTHRGPFQPLLFCDILWYLSNTLVTCQRIFVLLREVVAPDQVQRTHAWMLWLELGDCCHVGRNARRSRVVEGRRNGKRAAKSVSRLILGRVEGDTFGICLSSGLASLWLRNNPLLLAASDASYFFTAFNSVLTGKAWHCSSDGSVL